MEPAAADGPPRGGRAVAWLRLLKLLPTVLLLATAILEALYRLGLA